MARCGACNGQGYVRCPKCGGKGEIDGGSWWAGTSVLTATTPA